MIIGYKIINRILLLYYRCISISVCVCVWSRKARCEVALAVEDIYGVRSGKYCGSLSAIYSSMPGASTPAYHDLMSVYEHPHHPHILNNNNNNNHTDNSSADRDYATTLQIQQTVPPLWTCPVHGRVVSVMPQRAWRGADRLYEVAARLDTVHEDVASRDDLDVAAAAPAGGGARDDRDVLSPFYHELEPTLVDSPPCRH